MMTKIRRLIVCLASRGSVRTSRPFSRVVSSTQRAQTEQLTPCWWRWTKQQVTFCSAMSNPETLAQLHSSVNVPFNMDWNASQLLLNNSGAHKYISEQDGHEQFSASVQASIWIESLESIPKQTSRAWAKVTTSIWKRIQTEVRSLFGQFH